jgi:hypothetical protein
MSTEGVKLNISESGASLVAGKLGEVDKRLERLGGTAKRTGSTLRSALSKDIGAVTGAMGHLYTILGGAGFAAGAKSALDFKGKLSQLQIEARASTTEMKAIEDQVLKTASASGVMADEILEALTVFQNFGGVLKFGRDMMGEMVMLTKATGAPMQEVATIASSMHKTLGMNKDEIVGSFAALKAMGMAGTFSLAQQSPELKALMGTAAGARWKGAHGVQQMGASHQVVGRLLGTAESRTALEGMFRNLTAKSKGLHGVGIDVFDPKTNKMMDIDKLMLKIFSNKKIGTSMVGLSKVFNDEGLKAAKAFMLSYDQTTKGWRKGSDVDAIFGAGRGASSGDLKRDMELRSKGIGSASNQAKKALSALDAAVKEHGGHVVGFVAQNPALAALLGLGGYAGMKLAPSIGKALLSRGGAAAAAAAVVQRVFVVNMPGGGPGGLGGAGSAGAGAAGAAGRAGASLLRRVAGAALGVGIGLELGDYIDREGRPKLSSAEKATRDMGARGAIQHDLLKQAGFLVGVPGMTSEKAIKELQRSAKGHGQIGEDELRNLADKIGRLVSVLDKKGAVVVSAKGGLDKVEAKAGRGAQ